MTGRWAGGPRGIDPFGRFDRFDKLTAGRLKVEPYRLRLDVAAHVLMGVDWVALAMPGTDGDIRCYTARVTVAQEASTKVEPYRANGE
jgi:hypothetical protein